MNSSKKLALLCALSLSIPALAQTAVSGTKVQDGTGSGNLLLAGQWCFNSTCEAITNGAFSGSVTAGTETVTVFNASSVLILTVPNVVVGSSPFSWDSYVVPSSNTISGTGVPQIACQVGTVFTQTDSTPVNDSWTCYSVNNQGVRKRTNTPAGPTNTANAVIGEIPVTSSATPTFGNLANSTYMVLAQNVTFWSVVTGLPGQTLNISFCENTTGGYTVASAPANVTNWPGLTSTAANACITVAMAWISSQAVWNVNKVASGSGSFNALTNDASSTSTGGSTTVVGLLSHPLPSLATGYLGWNAATSSWALLGAAGATGALQKNTSGLLGAAVDGTG